MDPRLQPPGVNLIPVYRLVDGVANDHVYTIDPNEANTLAQQGTHTYEGMVFQLIPSPLPGTLPLHRFIRAGGQHMLDTQQPSAIDPSARYEATLGYVLGQANQGLVPLQLWVHRNGLFFYTTHPQGEAAGQIGYVYQGVVGFVAPGG